MFLLKKENSMVNKKVNNLGFYKCISNNSYNLNLISIWCYPLKTKNQRSVKSTFEISYYYILIILKWYAMAVLSS